MALGVCKFLDITTDTQRFPDGLPRLIGDIMRFRLAAYDALYVELALRTGCPLATFDKAMIASARSSWSRGSRRPLIRMYLIELYKSVQGESSFTGLPCIFVRFAGCNLRCAWCDSEYTFSGGRPFTQDEVLAQIEALAPCKLVEFTGGEPMLQAKELLPLMDVLLARGYTLIMETSGERPLDLVPKVVHKIVDVKCPGAGSAANSFRLQNLEALTPNDEVKFVLSHREDYDFARAFLAEHEVRRRVGGVLLSPAFSKSPSPLRTVDNATLDPRTLVEWMMTDGVDARLSLQIHKFIWEPMKKGV